MRVNGGPLLTIMVVRSWWWLLLGRGNHPRWYQCTFYVWFCACVCFQKAPLQIWKMQTNGGYELCCIFTSLEEKRWKCGCLFSPFFCFAAFDECTIGFRLLFYADMYILQWRRLSTPHVASTVFADIPVSNHSGIWIAVHPAASISEAGKLPQLQSSQLGSEDKWAELTAGPCISSPESFWWQIRLMIDMNKLSTL